jgi:hypothetical protein
LQRNNDEPSRKPDIFVIFKFKNSEYECESFFVRFLMDLSTIQLICLTYNTRYKLKNLQKIVIVVFITITSEVYLVYLGYKSEVRIIFLIYFITIYPNNN